jgi:hypothetical protein
MNRFFFAPAADLPGVESTNSICSACTSSIGSSGGGNLLYDTTKAAVAGLTRGRHCHVNLVPTASAP